ncbi:MAG TPA: TonB family protein, partial [Pyrinomonadaceae bacterium]
MKRLVHFIVILAFASLSAAGALAQSRRVYRVEPPKEERTEKSEKNDAATDKAGDEKKDRAHDKTQDKAQAETQTDDDKPVAAREVTERAVIKSKPLPSYPSEARGSGVEGRVVLRIILGSDGKVRTKIEVIEGLPYGITEEAIKAARRIKFEPAR